MSGRDEDGRKDARRDAAEVRAKRAEGVALKPGMKGPDGKRIPPPPHPKGHRVPRAGEFHDPEKQKDVGRYDAPARFMTRAQAEVELRNIFNFMKVGVLVGRKRIFLDPNKGNALINALRLFLDSKKFSEEMSLKMSGRATEERIQVLEQQSAELEEYWANRRPGLNPYS